MKKIISLIVAIAFMATMVAIPAAAEGEVPIATTQKYQIRGIRNGDVIVSNEETSRTISIVELKNSDTYNKDPKVPENLTKVEYYGDDNVLLDTVESFPYEYELVFDSYGVHNFKAIVYYTDDTGQAVKEVFESEYTVVCGTKLSGTFNATADSGTIECENSFYEDFDDVPADKVGVSLVLGDIPFMYSKHNSITMTYTEDGKLSLVSTGTSYYISLEPCTQSSSTDVIYYDFDISGSTYTIGSYYGKGSNSGPTITNRLAADAKFRIIVDFNSNYFIVQRNGAEVRRAKIDTSKLTNLRLRLAPTTKNAAVLINSIKCTSYDIKEPQKFSEASIQGGEDNPVQTDLAQIRVKGNDYLAGQNLENVITIDNDADFTPSIDGKDIVITFNEELAAGTTYTLTIDGVKDSDKLPYEEYTLSFRTLREGENPPPQAELKSPADGERYYPGDTITLSATATDSLGGSISYVEFYCDGELIEGSRTESSVDDLYTYEWSVDDTLESFDPHSITALACDNEGATVTTPAVKITVLSKQTPTVSITAPENGKSYASNFGGIKTDIKPTIKFDAADTDGDIALIEILIDGNGVYSGTGISQYIPETPLSAGSHNVGVLVTDNDGLSAYDEIELTVEEYGYTSYILRDDLSNTDLHSKYDKVGTVKSGNLSSFEDIKGIVISSDKPDTEKKSSLKRTCVNTLEGKPFSVDIKVAFGDTNSERKVTLDTFELYTFSKGGTYIPGEVYTVTALVDYNNLKLYTLLDGKAVGTPQTIKATTFTTSEVVTLTHTGGIGEYSETALLGIEIANMGKTNVQPEIKLSDENGNLLDITAPINADDAAYITASFVSGEVDSNSIKNNLLLVDDNTGERVALSYQSGKFTMSERLKYGTDYTLVLLPGVRDAAGKGYCGAYTVPFSTSAPADAVGVEDVSVIGGALNAGTYTATIGVDFNGVGEIGESVNVICTAYSGNKMIYCLPTVVNVGTALADVNIPIEISSVDANTVIEVFVVDNLTDLNPISDRIFVINQN